MLNPLGGAIVWRILISGLTIPTADGNLLHYSAVASEPLESKSHAPSAKCSASAALRRAAALAGLGTGVVRLSNAIDRGGYTEFQ